MGAAMAHHGLHRDLSRPCLPAPTLYAKKSDPPKFDSVCALVLAVLGDQNWVGDWELDDDERQALLANIEAEDETGKNADDGKLTLDEILEFISKDHNREVVRTFPASAQGILDPDLVKLAVKKFDVDGNGSLDDSEWSAFLEKLETLRIRYLLRISFQALDAFYGRGQMWSAPERDGPRDFTKEELREIGKGALLQDEPEEQRVLKNHDSESQSSSAYTRKRHPWVQIGIDEDAKGGQGKFGFIPPGYLEDLNYFSANFHPLHGIFCCDRNHRLSTYERIAMEAAAIGVTFFEGRLKTLWVHDGGAPVGVLRNELVFDYLVIALPSLIFRKILYYLFTCPCCIMDESRYGEAAIHRAHRCTRIGENLAFFLTALGIVSLIVRVCLVTVNHTGHYYAWDIFMSCLMSYLTVWASMLCLQFNLFISIGPANVHHTNKLQEFIIGLLPVGRWRLQKQRFKNRCIDAVEHLSKPEAARPTMVLKNAAGRKSFNANQRLLFRCCGNGDCGSCF